LRLRFKLARIFVDLTDSGRLFQTVGPATEKTQSPNLCKLCLQQTNIVVYNNTDNDNIMSREVQKNVLWEYIVCLEHKGDMSSFHNFTGNTKETFELVL